MATSTSPITQTLWAAEIPLHITHAAHSSSSPSSPSSSEPPPPPFVTTIPRFSYLSLLLPRLSAYFSLPTSSFHHESLLLRNLPAGLLVDLYRPAELPWRLVVSDGPDWDAADTFLNSVKEAAYVRDGTAKHVMALSRADTTDLWNAVRDGELGAYARVSARMLDVPAQLRHVPIRIYVPSSPPGAAAPAPSSPGSPGGAGAGRGGRPPPAGAFKVVQGLVPPQTSSRQPQLLGGALRSLLPSLFPSGRDPVLANVILHGAAVPFSAPVEELMREAAYPDGWLCLVVVLL